MDILPMRLLLADDDPDDCMFFNEALEEIPVSVKLTTVNDGVELMALLLKNGEALPDVLFLDLNMPRKNGFKCLTEIRQNEKLKHLTIIIYSTSLNRDVVESLREKGADYYIRKPGDYSKLITVIREALTIVSNTRGMRSFK